MNLNEPVTIELIAYILFMALFCTGYLILVHRIYTAIDKAKGESEEEAYRNGGKIPLKDKIIYYGVYLLAGLIPSLFLVAFGF